MYWLFLPQGFPATLTFTDLLSRDLLAISFLFGAQFHFHKLLIDLVTFQRFFSKGKLIYFLPIKIFLAKYVPIPEEAFMVQQILAMMTSNTINVPLFFQHS